MPGLRLRIRALTMKRPKQSRGSQGKVMSKDSAIKAYPITWLLPLSLETVKKYRKTRIYPSKFIKLSRNLGKMLGCLPSHK
jgi:hypothetical protein